MSDTPLKQRTWDEHFLKMAELVAQKSKDPSTKTGAVIVAADRTVMSTGYNGFARGVNDDPERYANRELKYKIVCHCELNAIILAKRDLNGCTLYTHPFMSCSNCAKYVIQAGIKRCVAPPLPEHLKERWGEDTRLAEMQFQEAGVKLDILP